MKTSYGKCVLVSATTLGCHHCEAAVPAEAIQSNKNASGLARLPRHYVPFFLLLFLPMSSVFSYTPTNIHQPYDGDFTQRLWAPSNTIQVGLRAQTMLQSKAYNGDEKRVSVTQIYGSDYSGVNESSLAMLEGSAPGTALHGLANRLRGAQDGVRGMFTVTGDLSWNQGCVDLIYRLGMIKLPGMFSFGVHVPFIEAAIHNVSWVSATKSQTLQDDRVKALLVSDQATLGSFVNKYGDMNIGDQMRAGLGDISCMLYWQGHFSQYQRRLRDVMVQFRLGVQIPTSHKVDIDRVFDIDFGHDGAAAIPLGAGLRLDLGGNVRVGVDVGATIIVRRLQEWRLKTSWAQTPFLTLSKGIATREYGPEWRFTVYGQTEIPKTGLFCTGGYQFFKHTDSTLYPQDDVMSALIINSSPTVDASESHNLLGALSFIPPRARTWKMLPEVSLQLTVPFNGKCVMSGVLLSGGISLKF